MVDFNSGPLIIKDVTIVSVDCQSDGGNTSKGFEVRMNNSSVYSYSLSNRKFNSQTVDVDISQDDYMTIYAVSSGSAARDATSCVTVRWRI